MSTTSTPVPVPHGAPSPDPDERAGTEQGGTEQGEPRSAEPAPRVVRTDVALRAAREPDAAVGSADAEEGLRLEIALALDGLELPSGPRGERGLPGERGERGLPGVGVEAVEIEGVEAVFRLSDGREQRLPLPPAGHGDAAPDEERIAEIVARSHGYALHIG
ncbi:MAG: hypothetical protein Q4E05_08260, partial [Pseudoclavibacter sp.]|nr:hypothetical protein [Pseudoclavibacter sp.]